MLLRATSRSRILRGALKMSTVAATKQIAEARDRVKYAEKVPSDIDISQSVTPFHISKIAEDAGATQTAMCCCDLVDCRLLGR